MSGDRFSRKKTVKIAWCLAEAVRSTVRDILRNSAQIALHTDAQGKFFSVRFTAVCAKTYSVSDGQLAMLEDIGTGSLAIMNAMMMALEKACVVRGGAPAGAHCEPHVEAELLSHVKDVVKLLDADGASDEQRALRLVSGGRLPSAVHKLKDACHAARRLTSKPWRGDPDINACLTRLSLASDRYAR